jgi:phosphoenolpyruvate-protein kinase (PTS system EI component)
VPASPGFAIGPAYCILPGPIRIETRPVNDAAIPAEVAGFNEASSAATQDFETLVIRVSQQVSEEEVILRAHRALLNDPGLAER